MALPGGPAGKPSAPAAPFTYPIYTKSDFAAVPPTRPPASLAESLGTTASNQARATVADQVAAIQQQQAADRASAAEVARQIGLASRAAAGFLGPGGYNLGGLAAKDYANAVAQTGGLASGYTGQLRDDLAAQTAAGQATLRSIPGNEQTLRDNGGSLANTLYGLQGSLPGQALAAEGLAATTTARLLPSQFLATGQNEALRALAAGRTDARALDPQITAARADLPKLTQDYLDAAIKQRLALAPQTGGSISTGLYQTDPLTGKITIRSQPVAAPQQPYRYQDGTGREFQINPDGSVVQLPGAPTPPSSSGFSLSPGAVRYDANGNVIASRPPNPASASSSGGFSLPPGETRYDANGNPIVTAPSSPKGPGGGLTPGEQRTAVTSFQSLASNNGLGSPTAASGSPWQYDSKGDTTIPAGQTGSAWIPNPNYVPAQPGQAVPYWDTVQQGVQAGLSFKKAVTITNSTRGYLTEGVNGRPFTGAAAARQARVGATHALQQGWTLQQALTAASAGGLVSPQVFTPIFTKAYRAAAGRAKQAKGLGLGGRVAGANPTATVVRGPRQGGALIPSQTQPGLIPLGPRPSFVSG